MLGRRKRQGGAFFGRLPAVFIALPGATLLLLATVRGADAQSAIPNVPQGSPLPHIVPQQPPKLGAGLPNFQPLTGGGVVPNAMIPVRSVTIIGATAFPAAQLGELTGGLAGRAVPLPKLEATRRQLVNLYRRHGFILTTVSMDIDAAGNVRLLLPKAESSR